MYKRQMPHNPNNPTILFPAKKGACPILNASEVHRARDVYKRQAVRYDENVISTHLEMLADEESLQELYEKISKSIHNLPLSVIQANKAKRYSKGASERDSRLGKSRTWRILP